MKYQINWPTLVSPLEKGFYLIHIIPVIKHDKHTEPSGSREIINNTKHFTCYNSKDSNLSLINFGPNEFTKIYSGTNYKM